MPIRKYIGSSMISTGNTGTARFLNFTVQGPRPATQPGTGWPSLHEPFGDIPEANLLKHQLETSADGSFELWLGGEKRDANWLPTTPGTRKLFVRQGFDSWDETPAQFSIERVGMEKPRPLQTPAASSIRPASTASRRSAPPTAPMTPGAGGWLRTCAGHWHRRRR